MKTAKLLMMLAVVTVGLMLPSHAAVLSGVGVSATLAGEPGEFTGVYWNTVYNENYADILVNGNQFAPPVALAPGNNVFSLEFQPGYVGDGYYAVNVFFDGDINVPKISAVLTLPSTLTPNGNLDTYILLGDNGGVHVAGANTLSFTVGTETVTLTAFSINEASGPSMTGSMTLRVEDSSSAVPEPQSALLFLSGAALLITVGRKRALRS